MRDHYIIQFGKYKGKMIGEIPPDYKIWLLNEMKNKKHISPFAKEMIEYLESNLEYYKQQIGAK